MTDSEYLSGSDKGGNCPACFVADEGIDSSIAADFSCSPMVALAWECVKPATECEGPILKFMKHSQPP